MVSLYNYKVWSILLGFKVKHKAVHICKVEGKLEMISKSKERETFTAIVYSLLYSEPSK